MFSCGQLEAAAMALRASAEQAHKRGLELAEELNHDPEIAAASMPLVAAIGLTRDLCFAFADALNAMAKEPLKDG
jgi:hypothetical protein